MIRIEKIIIIGATARHSGKTELASAIIKTFSKKEKITGIKISTVIDGDTSFHGNIENLNSKFIITKNTSANTNKSTDRMLTAGAFEAFLVHSKAEYLDEALIQLVSMIDKNSFIVCESNSLRKSVIPDVFIMIKNTTQPLKDSTTSVIKYADLIIDSNGKEFSNFDLSSITIENGQWAINNNK